MRDKAKVISDLTSDVGPLFGNYFLEEVQYDVGELLLSWIAAGVRDMGMQDGPETLNRVQVWAVCG